MPVPRAHIPVELRGPLLVLIIVVPLLAFLGFKVHDGVTAAHAYQLTIRQAQFDRARLMRYTLDEETGIRGYVATRDPLFLEPFTAAERQLPPTYEKLETRLTALSMPDAHQIVEHERAQNARWIATIAEPLRRAPNSAQMPALMRTGKVLIDEFRSEDAVLQGILGDRASAADARSEKAIADVLSFVIGALVLVTVTTAMFSWLQTRAARRVFESELLYRNQKRIADELQTAFLNKRLPVTPQLELHATYIPALSEARVGGDWYDAFELPDKRILFSIGDVAGHGLEAAVVMSRARQAIIASALHATDPATVLEHANAAILLQESRMVTAICGYIDPVTLDVVYATAGHPPPILVLPGSPAAFMPHDGLPLGILPDAHYRTFTLTAGDGAILVLYTDGVIEHTRDIIAGEALLLEAARLAVTAEDPALAIERQVFARSAPTDDVAILAIRFRSGAAATRSTVAARRLEAPDVSRPAAAKGVARRTLASPPTEAPAGRRAGAASRSPRTRRSNPRATIAANGESAHRSL